MCDFLSFRVEPTSEGLKLKFAHSLNSHSHIPEPGYECEWDENNEIEVRLPDDEPESKADIVRDWLRGQFKNQQAIFEYAVKSLDWSGDNNDLDLRGTQITALPDGLSVGRYLDLQGTQITALPDGLSVGGYLYLQGTQIKPENVPAHLKSKAVF